MTSNGSSSSSSVARFESRSLLVLIVDVSPLAWGERDLQRTAQDKSRKAAGKERSVGPAVLEEALQSVAAFGSAYLSLERTAGLVILAVADNASAIVFPCKSVLQEWLSQGGAAETYVADPRQMQRDVYSGVNELVHRALSNIKNHSSAASRQASLAAACSKALCLLNRILVASQAGGGVSALHSSGNILSGSQDDSIVALMEPGKSASKQSTRRPWTPRILMIQASEDRSRDYNAFMNCAFAAKKQNVAIDGCFLEKSSSSSSSNASNASFLAQVCDLTGGIFLRPTGASQVQGALTAVLLSVFLPQLEIRNGLNFPAANLVDFRARCFDTTEAVHQAYVCNLCLSIFQNRPKGTTCPTCDATIFNNKKQKTG